MSDTPPPPPPPPAGPPYPPPGQPGWPPPGPPAGYPPPGYPPPGQPPAGYPPPPPPGQPGQWAHAPYPQYPSYPQQGQPGAYPGYGQPPAPSGLPPVTEPVPYHRLHRAGRRGWWRPLVGILALMATVMIVVPAILSIALMIWLFTQGADLAAESERLLSLEDPTPFGLAFLNIVLASAIPAVLLLTWLLHGLKPRWVTSVFPRMRWMFFFACIGLSVVALVATVVVSALVPSEPVGDLGGGLNDFTTETTWFLLVVLFLTPLQSAGEEYAFRGYLTQAFGGLFPTWVAVVGPALLFALAHGASQDLPVFFDRFAFGLVAGILVVRTGGLEAGIAMHVLNNFLAFGLALALGDLGESLNPTDGSWWSIPVTLTQSLVYLGLALWLAKRMGLSRVADPAVLAASRGRV